MSATETDRFALRGMDHFTVVTTDCGRTSEFFEMFGLRPGPRPPDLGVDGVWLYNQDKPILHIVTRGVLPDDKAGLLDHIAFRATGLRRVVALLKQRGVAWRMRRLNDPFGVWQMFFKDPFGANVELDFDGEEPGPEGWPAGNAWGTG